MSEEYESSIHTYFKNSAVCVGDLMCEIKENNEHDKICCCGKDEFGQIVGHVPIEISRPFSKFIRDYGEIETECIGNRFNAGQGKGLEIQVDLQTHWKSAISETISEEAEQERS